MEATPAGHDNGAVCEESIDKVLRPPPAISVDATACWSTLTAM